MQIDYTIEEQYPKLIEQKQDIRDFLSTLYDRCKCWSREQADWPTYWHYRNRAEAQLNHISKTIDAPLEQKADQVTSSIYWDLFDIGERDNAEYTRRRIDAELAKDLQLDYFDIVFDWVIKQKRPSTLAKAYYSLATAHSKKKKLEKDNEFSRCWNKLWYDNRVAIINLIGDCIRELQPNTKGFPHFQYIDDSVVDPALDSSIQHNEELA